ncbi:hypothetical protein [Streptomyces blastmyceticus]|uniref:Uncharacterized protein n=1 Tax=Streptomyces blastmyceticus TaxID=68180 RepID=A0ABN0Y2D2_9ACTN
MRTWRAAVAAASMAVLAFAGGTSPAAAAAPSIPATVPQGGDAYGGSVEASKAGSTAGATAVIRCESALAPLVQRSDQTDKAIADHETSLDSLERARWPLPSLAALVSLAAVIVSIWQATAAH